MLKRRALPLRGGPLQLLQSQELREKQAGVGEAPCGGPGRQRPGLHDGASSGTSLSLEPEKASFAFFLPNHSLNVPREDNS